jgi:hypothetical protein
MSFELVKRGKKQDCEEKLVILANTIDDFVADLRKNLTDLHADGQLPTNAYDLVMNLVKGYWDDTSSYTPYHA